MSKVTDNRTIDDMHISLHVICVPVNLCHRNLQPMTQTESDLSQKQTLRRVSFPAGCLVNQVISDGLEGQIESRTLKTHLLQAYMLHVM